ncbi:MAG: Alpha/beta hydrolase family protein [Deltaproteobacteria bacterium]|nr:Alpha/beta hydrolase family protein [Deltaproteobacteria bacterium]
MVLPEGESRLPCVVLSHGLISSKESTKYVAISERFARAGIASCRFDYHGCGDSGGKIEETTLSIRLDNLNAIVEYALRHHGVNPDKVGIIGSSFGGTAGLIKSARDKRIKCLSLWATPYVLAKEGNGSIDNIFFKDDIYTDFSMYDILSESENISHALVVHGEKDETVPCGEGKKIYERLQQPKHIEIIEKGDHVFSDPSHRERVIDLALNWFDKHLIKRQ